MANFWTAEDKIPIGQTKISVPAEHGLDYSPGQKIEFHIPASVNFFQPKESYLKFDVLLSNPATAKAFLQLDGQLGGQVLIRDLRVYSGGSGRVLLEEYQNYNVLAAVKYDYELNDSIKQKRSLTEGCVYYDDRHRSTTGLNTDTANNLSNNPYFDAPAAERTTTTTAEPGFKKAKCLLPLNTGIFSNDKIFPVGLTEGLIVEIILEEAKNCIRTLDNVAEKRKLLANPVFLSASGTSDGTAGPADPNLNPQYPAAGTANGASAFQVFYVRRDNVMGINADTGAAQIPFCKGQRIKFYDVNAQAVISSASNTAYGTITNIQYVEGTKNCAYITLAAMFDPSANMNVNCVVIDDSIASTTSANWKPSYEVTNCEFIVQQVTMPSGYTSKLASMMKEGGAMNYDFLSWTNYKTSQIASEKLTTLRVPLTQARAKCVLAIPTDASVYTQKDIMRGHNTPIEDYEKDTESDVCQNRCVRAGLVGITDNITQYQLFYDGKLNPSRKVKCSKISGMFSVDQQPLIELEKALVMGGIKPHSMLAFRKNFVIGRALSLQDGVYDTRGKDFQLQVEYQETDEPEFNKLWNVWCGHLRRLVISGNAIQIVV
jgi:hypothetical protein